MARKANVQSLLDSLFSQIGSEVARGVADGLARSGLMKSVRALSRGAQKTRPAVKTAGKRGRPKGPAKSCSVKGCKKPARAKGLCSQHYQQKRYAQMNKKTTAKKGKKKKAAKRARPAPKKRKAKRQNPGKAPRRTAKTCKVKGCNKKVYARGMCGQHFMAWVRSKKK
jgi:hypothetical protein